MSEFTIEKDVPIPPGTGKSGRPCRYPWADMKAGDSFLAPMDTKGRFYNLGNRYFENHGIDLKIHTRREGDQCRVWAIAKAEGTDR